MSYIFFLLLVISLIFFVWGIFSPNFLKKVIKRDMTRKNNLLTYSSLIIISFFLIGVTAPETNTSVKNVVDQVDNQIAPAEEKLIVDNENTSTNLGVEQIKQNNTYSVVKVVDGDTLDVSINGKTQRLRLIGIDTPETVDPRKPVECFGKEASNKSKETLSRKKVFLEADSSQGEYDKYDRLLRYVFLEDGTNFNLLMIKEGYAHEYTYGTPYKYQSAFKQAQKDAEASKKGLWAPGICEEKPKPAPVVTTPKTTQQQSSQCNQNYSGCLKKDAGDYDCSGGSGDGPNYTGAVQVLGYDEYKLDRDGDGWGCE